MPVSKKQQACVTKYVKEHYDRISVTVPQGKKAELQAHAAAHGESVNGFINRAIDETMGRDLGDSREKEEQPERVFTIVEEPERERPEYVFVKTSDPMKDRKKYSWKNPDT